MLELDIDHAEEIILKLLINLEKKVNAKSGMTPEEVREFYNNLLHNAFTEESVRAYKNP